MNTLFLKPNRETIFYEKENYLVEKSKNQILKTLDDVNIDLGSYVLNISIFNSDDKKTISLDKQFFSRWLGLPANIVDIDKAVEQMVYIATPEELNYMSKKLNHRMKSLKDFLNTGKQKIPHRTMMKMKCLPSITAELNIPMIIFPITEKAGNLTEEWCLLF